MDELNEDVDKLNGDVDKLDEDADKLDDDIDEIEEGVLENEDDMYDNYILGLNNEESENSDMESEESDKADEDVAGENNKPKKGVKNWNFPKIHTHRHAFDDIEAKGVTRNYNTKPNKKLHGLLRNIYHRQTNYRNLAPQV